MFKPRLRIPPRRTGLPRPCLSSQSPHGPPTSSPLAAAAAATAAARAQRRSIHATPARCRHAVPKLNDGEKPFATNGVSGLYSANGFDAAYTQYQKWCLDELNRLTEGTRYEGMEVKDLAIMTSREPGLAAIFNHASMAHNNHFFFDGLAAQGGQDPAEHMPAPLQRELERSFGSLETLQRELLLTANAMFGPGFVWLARATDGHGAQRFPFRVLATYLAGSPYPAAHWRKQGTDMNAQGGVTDSAGETIRHYFDMQNRAAGRAPLHGSSAAGAGTAGGGSLLSREGHKNPGGAALVPVLCVNTWEHAWLYDWGIGGKFEYLAAWWSVINWGKVAERASLVGGKQMTAEPALAPQPEKTAATTTTAAGQ